jgi:hypothetical protein
MTPDLDLSDLKTGQAALWLFLQVDAILTQIHTDQAKRWASNRSGRSAALTAKLGRVPGDRSRVGSSRLCGESNLETLCALLSEPVSPWDRQIFPRRRVCNLVSRWLN